MGGDLWEEKKKTCVSVDILSLVHWPRTNAKITIDDSFLLKPSRTECELRLCRERLVGQLALLGLGRQRSVRKEASAESEQGVKWLIGTKAFYWLIKPLKIFYIIWFLQAPGPVLKNRKRQKQQQKARA